MAALTLLQIAQEFCRRRGLPIPATVTGAQDDTTLQIWGLLNEGVADLADSYEWQQLRSRYSFTHANGANYEALTLDESGSLPDYKALLNRTLWDNMGRREVNGPLSPKEWEVLLNLNISQAVYNFTLYGNSLRIYPVPTVTTDTFSLEYLSKYGVITGSTNTEFFNTDASVCRFPASLMLADIKWRWAAAKGLSYAEDFRMCESMKVNLQGREPAPDIIMDQDRFTQVAAPGLLVAAGSWNIP